jgi:hypothetical protein
VEELMSKNLFARATTVMVAILGVLVALAAASPVAQAAPAQLHVSPTTVAAGQSVQVSGVCEASTTGFVLSRAFLHDRTHDFAGVGAISFATNSAGQFSGRASIPATTAAGNYPVTARCGGGNLGISVTLTVTAPGAGGVPTGVPAGTAGLAATHSGSGKQWIGVGAAGAVFLAVGCLALGRRRAQRH